MEGLSLGVKQMSIGTKSVLPPIGSGRKNSYTKNILPQTDKKSRGKPEGGMGVTGGRVASSRKASPQHMPPRSGDKVTSSSVAPVSKGAANGTGKPTKMHRPKQWSPEAENAYRFQSAGFRDTVEYQETYPTPELWEETGFVRQLQVKSSGFFMYFRQTRECDDKYLGKTKIYSY